MSSDTKANNVRKCADGSNSEVCSCCSREVKPLNEGLCSTAEALERIMENVLIKINQKYVSLSEDEKKRNAKILEQILESLTSKLKEKNDLFRNMFERTFFGGSYYDKIKVGKPEEYDLDLVFNLPLLAEPDVEISDLHGFVCVKIKEYVKLLKSPDGKKFDKLDSLMDGEYLSTQKVLQWMERIIALALRESEKDADGHYFGVDMGQKNPAKIYASIAKAHPAFTLKLKSKDSSFTFDVDLVPCIQFTDKKWPKGDYRSNPQPSKNKFFVVPKKPKESAEGKDINKYWRLSFQEQERDLMKGNELNKMKPSIRLLKLLRDKYNHNIASYFIKTVFLWEIEARDKSFWGEPLNVVFMQMLQKYAEMLEKKRIPYYWNKHFNLIGHLKDSTITGIGNCLRKLISDVNNNPDDPFRISKYLLPPDQIEILKTEVSIGKKHLKQLSVLESSVGNRFDDLNVSIENDRMSSSSSSGTASKPADDAESSSNITSKSNSKNDTFSLRESLALSSKGLLDTIEQLFEQNRQLRESNRVILKVCDTLNERLLNLERKCEELSDENRLLARKIETPVFSASGEFGDRLGLTASFLQMNGTDSNDLNL